MNYKVEKDWRCEGLRCVVIAVDSGHRCGYVGVTKKHILFGKAYSDVIPDVLKPVLREVKEGSIGKRGVIDIVCFNEDAPKIGILFDVHGSITYSGGDNYPVKSSRWWFGFDCNHFGDSKDWDIISEKYKEPERKHSFYSEGTVRTLLYCEKECESLARQLKEIGGIK